MGNTKDRDNLFVANDKRPPFHPPAEACTACIALHLHEVEATSKRFKPRINPKNETNKPPLSVSAPWPSLLLLLLQAWWHCRPSCRPRPRPSWWTTTPSATWTTSPHPRTAASGTSASSATAWLSFVRTSFVSVWMTRIYVDLDMWLACMYVYAFVWMISCGWHIYAYGWRRWVKRARVWVWRKACVCM